MPAGGSALPLRASSTGDRAIPREAFDHLAEGARYMRFLRQGKHLSEEGLTYPTDVDRTTHFAWVAAVPGDRPEGAGVGRWIRLADEPSIAEIAVTVADRFQRQGLGRTLLAL